MLSTIVINLSFLSEEDRWFKTSSSSVSVPISTSILWETRFPEAFVGEPLLVVGDEEDENELSPLESFRCNVGVINLMLLTWGFLPCIFSTGIDEDNLSGNGLENIIEFSRSLSTDIRIWKLPGEAFFKKLTDLCAVWKQYSVEDICSSYIHRLASRRQFYYLEGSLQLWSLSLSQ